MKKVFLVLFASAAFSIGACNSGSHTEEGNDSTAMKSDVQQAIQSVDSTTQSAPMDSTQMTDTTKKM